jgi:hypothetical protein
VEAFKAPRSLVAALPEEQVKTETRLATFEYFQPSLVFYSRRQVETLPTEAAALQFLQGPNTAYLFIPAAAWEKLAPLAGPSAHLLDRRYDLYDRHDIVVVEAKHSN